MTWQEGASPDRDYHWDLPAGAGARRAVLLTHLCSPRVCFVVFWVRDDSCRCCPCCLMCNHGAFQLSGLAGLSHLGSPDCKLKLRRWQPAKERLRERCCVQSLGRSAAPNGVCATRGAYCGVPRSVHCLLAKYQPVASNFRSLLVPGMLGSVTKSCCEILA